MRCLRFIERSLISPYRGLSGPYRAIFVPGKERHVKEEVPVQKGRREKKRVINYPIMGKILPENNLSRHRFWGMINHLSWSKGNPGDRESQLIPAQKRGNGGFEVLSP
jgi:hypothetical protein